MVSPVSASRRWARRAKKAGAGLRPAASCHGAKNEDRMTPFGIFSIPKTRTRSCCPDAIDAGAELQRGTAGGATRLDVVDRDAGPGQRAEDTVAGGDPAVGGAAERRLQVADADAGFVQCGRTATTPMSVPVIPSKRPNGCSPTPAIRTSLMGGTPR